MSIFLSGCMLAGMPPSTLLHVVIIPLLKCKSKDPANVNNYRPIVIATALSKVLEQILLSRLAIYLQTTDSQFGFKRAHWTEMAYLHTSKQIFTVIRTHMYTYALLMQIRNLIELIIGRWHIVKLFIFWYRE